MPKYKVWASYRVNLSLDVEAESRDDAWKIAREADGATFTPVNNSDWEINDVTDMELIKLYGME